MHLQTLFKVYFRYHISYLRFSAQLFFLQLYYLAMAKQTSLYKSNTVLQLSGTEHSAHRHKMNSRKCKKIYAWQCLVTYMNYLYKGITIMILVVIAN